MTKLVAVTVAAWLVVALIGAEGFQSTPEEETPEEIAARAIEAKRIDAKPGDERTTEDWKTLTLAYRDILLGVSQTNQMSADDVHAILGKLFDAVNHPKIRSYTKAHFPIDIKVLLYLGEPGDCTESRYLDKFAKIYDQVKYKTPLKNYLIDSLRQHLRKCHYERWLEEEIGHSKRVGRNQWDWMKYPTLGSFLLAELYQTERISAEFIWVISLVGDIWRLSAPNESDCANQTIRQSLLERLVRTKMHYPDLHKLVDAYFVTYLGDCGLEAKFRRAMGNYDDTAMSRGSTALADYLLGAEFGEQVWDRLNVREAAREFSFALELVNLLVDINEFDESHCKTDFVLKVHHQIEHSREEKYTKLHNYVKDASEGYSKVCNDKFKLKADEFLKTKAGNWWTIERFKGCLEEFIHKYKGTKFGQIGNTVKDLKYLDKSNFGADNYCFKKFDFKQPCEALLEHMGDSMLPLSLNTKAKADKSNQSAIKNIYYCAGALDRSYQTPWRYLYWLAK